MDEPINVEAIRKALGWSQADLAREMGVTQSRVSRIETSARDMRGPEKIVLRLFAERAKEIIE